MTLRIKRYQIDILPDKLLVHSTWRRQGKFTMAFKIQRWNPLTYIKPAALLFTRKFLRKLYFKIRKDDPQWHLCSICHEKVGTDYMGDFAVCMWCKKLYDEQEKCCVNGCGKPLYASNWYCEEHRTMDRGLYRA